MDLTLRWKKAHPRRANLHDYRQNNRLNLQSQANWLLFFWGTQNSRAFALLLFSKSPIWDEDYVKKPECPALPSALSRQGGDEWPRGFGDQPPKVTGFFTVSFGE